MRVLLVEDDVESSGAIGALLDREGIAVEFAHDGETGLRRAGDPSIDVVILDRMLPALDGIAVTARMRGGRIGQARADPLGIGSERPARGGAGRRRGRLSGETVRTPRS